MALDLHHPAATLLCLAAAASVASMRHPVQPAGGTTYYVDASGGDDANDGLSPATAWKSVNKVSATGFSAGDVIRFKRGETWNLTYNRSLNLSREAGAPGRPITVTDYGSGRRPVISAIEDVSAGEWIAQGNNIWFRAGFTAYPWIARCWVNRKESVRASSVAAIDGTTRLWYFGGQGGLYVYADSEPDSVEIARIGYCVRLRDSSYVTVRNLVLIGGSIATLEIRNSSHHVAVIDNALLRSGNHGIRGSVDAGSGDAIRDVVVRGNLVDGQIDLIGYELASTEKVNEDGVLLRDACSSWIVADNVVRNFSHSLIHVAALDPSANGTHDNLIERNTLLGGNSHYIRGLDVNGVEGKCTGNAVRGNVIDRCNVRSQTNGNSNEYVGNVFRNIERTPATNKSDVSEGIQLAGWTTGGQLFVCHDNEIRDNVFHGVHNEGISIDSPHPRDNVIENNVVVDAGRGGDKPNIAVFVSARVTGDNTVAGNCLCDEDEDETISYGGRLFTVDEANAQLAEFTANESCSTCPRGMCIFRNGAGINPAGFTCVTSPVLGTNWSSAVATGPMTISTFVAISSAPTHEAFFGGELLVDAGPPAVFLSGAGTHSMRIPNSIVLLGAPLFTQGFRLDDSGSGNPTLVLLNAQDLLIGS